MIDNKAEGAAGAARSPCGEIHDGAACFSCRGVGAVGAERGGGTRCNFCCGTGRLLRPFTAAPAAPSSSPAVQQEGLGPPSAGSLCEVCGRNPMPVHGGCWRLYGNPSDTIECYRLGYEREKARAEQALTREGDMFEEATRRMIEANELRAALALATGNATPQEAPSSLSVAAEAVQGKLQQQGGPAAHPPTMTVPTSLLWAARAALDDVNGLLGGEGDPEGEEVATIAELVRDRLDAVLRPTVFPPGSRLEIKARERAAEYHNEKPLKKAGPRCSAKTRKGNPCAMASSTKSGLCLNHAASAWDRYQSRERGRSPPPEAVPSSSPAQSGDPEER